MVVAFEPRRDVMATDKLRAALPSEGLRARYGWVAERLPGLLVCLTIGLATTFLSDHYGGPTILYALLLGMAFHFLSQEGRCVAGVEFAARTVLRLGVALLGARITATQVVQLGWGPVLTVIVGVASTIVVGRLLARAFGVDRELGLLTGGAVAICGASAALALSAVMPRGEHGERNLILTVVGVTTLSTIAMVTYPLLVKSLGLDHAAAGVFLGGTIHDVAQVVGAGYIISPETGDVSTVVKLMRVAMLVPAVLAFSLLFRQSQQRSGQAGRRPSLLPLFLVAFVADCGLVVDPDAEELAQIALASTDSARSLLDLEPRVAMLSFSTGGSTRHPLVEKVVAATRLARSRRPELMIEGDVELDASIMPEISVRKAPGSVVKGRANVLIFPDLEAGNIGYKMAERMGKAKAIGPVLQGLARPANDLSSGCTAEDVFRLIAVTVVQAQSHAPASGRQPSSAGVPAGR
jgi:phosphate acetyltransferase